MKALKTIFLTVISFMAFHSCNLLGDNPQKVFNLTALNANKVPRDFERSFKEVRGQKETYGLKIPVPGSNTERKNASCQEYFAFYYGTMFDKDIQRIKELKKDKETTPIIAAALDLFEYNAQIYKKDFLVIAKMMDENKPQAEIDQAIIALQDAKMLILDEKADKLMAVALPYADKHGVKYKTMTLPNFK